MRGQRISGRVGVAEASSRRLPLAAVVTALSAALLAVPSVAQAGPATDRYIVVLEDGVSHPAEVANQHSRRYAAQVSYVYRHAVSGYAAQVEGRELGALRSDPRVAYVERDGSVEASTVQPNATWGLDRIDQPFLPLSESLGTTGATTPSRTARVASRR